LFFLAWKSGEILELSIVAVDTYKPPCVAVAHGDVIKPQFGAANGAGHVHISWTMTVTEDLVRLIRLITDPAGIPELVATFHTKFHRIHSLSSQVFILLDLILSLLKKIPLNPPLQRGTFMLSLVKVIITLPPFAKSDFLPPPFSKRGAVCCKPWADPRVNNIALALPNLFLTLTGL
jgi:hypothetical protein